MQRISSELSLIRKSFSGGFFVLSVELALGKWFFDHFRRARELAWYRENPSLSAQHSNRVIGKLWENFCRQFFSGSCVCRQTNERNMKIKQANISMSSRRWLSVSLWLYCMHMGFLARTISAMCRKALAIFFYVFREGEEEEARKCFIEFFFLSHALVEAERVCCTTQFLIKFTRQQCSSATGWKVKCVGAEEEDDMHQMAREREGFAKVQLARLTHNFSLATGSNFTLRGTTGSQF